ncbi:dihydrolipoamide dehydrogenase [Natronocella acetinitrilica]|uniref:Dihydrolipoyl dehydrogenase n=1 Tax=Natronocella acetinitrilica TaxID=414046 RepID=A0AAE3G0P7_9GAMM|nr:dihydrolipoyl dehydrogenase [Natronocella acetinitrilica]MCP1673320.1 dihydrolipoamide dehydrogenase [Natronocella acetinitrilica]
MASKEIKVPDIGDFDAVDIIEVLVAEGDTVEPEQSLITLESDKATMEVPAPEGGKVGKLRVKVGDKVKEGDVILDLEPAAGGAATADDKPAEAPKQAKTPEPAKPAPAKQAATDAPSDADCDVVVIGAGPGGYTAAFRAADLGLKVVLVERYETLGGVCLNVGCIPSKALLHVGHIMDTAAAFKDHGIVFAKPKIELDKLRGWKDKVIGKLTGGLASMAKQRKVETVFGNAEFTGSHSLDVKGKDGTRSIKFKHAIIAAGSRPVVPPGMDLDDPRVMDSTGALKLEEIPKRLLVVGGGIIGLEMATVYEALGSKITVVELMDRIMVGADKDLVRPYEKRIRARYENVFLNTKVTGMEAQKKGIKVTFEGKDAPESDTFDRVLLSVGRRPNGDLLNLEASGVPSDRGFIQVDEHMQTAVPHIYAIGDIVGQPMLAHKATHEGKVAAECIAGEKSAFDARVIPSVAYTDPEVAWVGLTEEQAKEQGIKVEKGVFPWAASGRALAMGREEGMTKLLFDEETGRLLGGAALGPNAGDLMGEIALAIEMGAEASDIGLTVHPHPTLIETVAMAAEAAEGTITDLYIPKKKK